jgi:hypothetical protein
MTKGEPQFEVLREGKVHPLTGSGGLGVSHEDALVQMRAMLLSGYLTEAPPSNVGLRYLIVPHHEVRDHVFLMTENRVCKYAAPKLKRDADPMDGWLHFLSIMPDLPKRLSERANELSEERIQALMDVMIDVDPFEPVEAKIDARNAELRAEFLSDFEVYDSATVHRKAGLKGTNTSQTVNSWRLRGRVLGLKIQGRMGYPAFQFDADGMPIQLVEVILSKLPKHLTPWQRAFWFVSPKEELDGETPIYALKTADVRVIDAANAADELPAG